MRAPVALISLSLTESQQVLGFILLRQFFKRLRTLWVKRFLGCCSWDLLWEVGDDVLLSLLSLPPLRLHNESASSIWRKLTFDYWICKVHNCHNLWWIYQHKSWMQMRKNCPAQVDADPTLRLHGLVTVLEAWENCTEIINHKDTLGDLLWYPEQTFRMFPHQFDEGISEFRWKTFHRICVSCIQPSKTDGVTKGINFR